MFYVHASDNTKIAVYDMNPNGSRTVLLVHGWPLSHKMFEYQLPALLEADFRVVMMDLRGFGNSDVPATGYHYDQMAEDIYYVVRALRLDDFGLLGFSMGGAVSVRYMARYKGYGVEKLILLDAAAPSYCKNRRNPYGQTVESTDKLIAMGYKDRPAVNKYFGSIFLATEHSMPFKDWLQRLCDSSSGTGQMECLNALRNEDVSDDLAAIRVPTAIIHGREDQICPYGMAGIMHKQIRNSQLYAVEHAGHGACFDQVEECNQLITGFMQ